MKILRLLVTEDCNRTCEGCCNKTIKPSIEIKENELISFVDDNRIETVIITGGEPLLYPFNIRFILYKLKNHSNLSHGLNTILYTADCKKLKQFLQLLKNSDNNDCLDSITLTIHEQKDLKDFYELNDFLYKEHKEFNFRLNLFTGITFTKPINLYHYDVKYVDWIKNCPLPEQEIFASLKHY